MSALVSIAGALMLNLRKRGVLDAETEAEVYGFASWIAHMPRPDMQPAYDQTIAAVQVASCWSLAGKDGKPLD